MTCGNLRGLARAAIAGLALLALAPAQAGQFGLGITLNASGWDGDNGPGRASFASDEGGQFGLALKYSDARFYSGVDLQGGDYRFSGAAPDRFTADGVLESRDTRVRHNDFSLLAGYYFWPRVSLFASLKSATSRWREDNYRQTFGGLGFGVAGFHPLDDDWMLFGSLGVVGGEDDDGRRLGDGSSSALAAGAVVQLGDGNSLNFGLKFRGFDFEFDDGNRQRYSLNGLFFGFQHQFD